jgi:hypothetical protein
MTPQGTGVEPLSPAPPIPAPSGARNYQKEEVTNPNEQRLVGSSAGRHWANLMAVSGQFSRPPLGRS